MVRILHLSDIHLGSGFVHGHINPATGLNTRFEDFVAALSRCMDFALGVADPTSPDTADPNPAEQMPTEPVDLVLFGGDAFPDATPPPYIQEAFAAQFRRLVDANIPVVLLIGNHDQYSQGQGGASLALYRTLAVPGVIVGDTLATHRIETKAGPVQVTTLPWLTRSTLLTRPETEGLSLTEVSDCLRQRLRVALEGEFRQMDPEIPTVLLAHAMLDTAMYGAERFLAVGKGFTLPMSLLTRDCLDYVALGHVHRHQVLCESPPVVYPGSIERVDFSEEKEEKGFVWVNLERGKVTFEFQPLPVRAFRTIRVDLSKAEDPQAALMAAIAKQASCGTAKQGGIAKQGIDNAIVRLLYQVRPEQLSVLDDAEIHAALAPAHHYSIQPELISQLARPRLPGLTADSGLNPIDALKTFIHHRDDLQEMEADLVAAAEALLQDEVWQISDSDGAAQRAQDLTGVYDATQQPEQTQLRLL